MVVIGGSLLLGDETLPVWANVLLGIVGGGAIGGVVSTVLQSRSRTSEEWRERMLAAADDFAQSFWLAHQQLSAVLDLSYKIHGELMDEITLRDDEQEILSGAERLLGDVLLRLARVGLLFGEESAATAAAREARRRLRSVYNSLDPQPDYPMSDAHRAWNYLNEAETAHERFSSLARESAVRGSTKAKRAQPPSDDDE